MFRTEPVSSHSQLQRKHLSPHTAGMGRWVGTTAALVLTVGCFGERGPGASGLVEAARELQTLTARGTLPSDVSSLQKLVKLYQETGDPRAAEETLAKLQQATGRTAFVHAQQVELAVRQGLYQRALSLADTAIQAGMDESSLSDESRRRLEQARGIARSMKPSQGENETKIPVVRVPSGTFVPGDGLANQAEPPVRVSEFHIGLHEVTNADFVEFLKATGYQGDFGDPTPFSGPGDLPAVGVSWNDAVAFTIWLSSRSKATFRLPTEAEWEYAARFSHWGKEPWGSSPGVPGVHGNWGLETRLAEGQREMFLRPVGSFLTGASALRIMDLAGNAAEWCLDVFDPNDRQWLSRSDPFGRSNGERVLRGSSWKDGLSVGAAIERRKAGSNQAYSGFGFRVVRKD